MVMLEVFMVVEVELVVILVMVVMEVAVMVSVIIIMHVRNSKSSVCASPHISQIVHNRKILFLRRQPQKFNSAVTSMG
jgi:hypothetical protein